VASEDAGGWNVAGPTTEGSPDAVSDDGTMEALATLGGGEEEMNPSMSPVSCSMGGREGKSLHATSLIVASTPPSADCIGVLSEDQGLLGESELVSVELESVLSGSAA